MCDSGEELVGDFEEIEGDAVVTEITEKKSTYGKDTVKYRSSSGSAATKRKASSPTRAVSSKTKRVESEKKSVNTRDNDRNLFSAVQEHGRVSGNVRIGDEKVSVPEVSGGFMHEVPEEELLALDSSFADKMFERISTKLQPKASGGYRTKVCISPLVVLDMADSAMQQLVKSQQPNICFFFKGQNGKSMKKKGYAEIFVEKDKDWYTLLHHLCRVNFEEKRIKITVSIIKASDNKLHAEGSFVLRRSRLEKISKLLQDVKENDTRPIDKDCFLLVSEVPDDISLSYLRHFFPFLPTFTTKDCHPIKSRPGFKGPIQACYRDLAQVKSVSDIFVDFTVNGHTLTVQRCNQNQGDKVVSSESEKSLGENLKAEGGLQRPTASVEDKQIAEKSTEEKGEEEIDEDDDISSMARDLCSDMRESLNKLKEMETENPNIQKILEFQDQLAQLQKTLAKPGKKSEEEDDDPWTVTSENVEPPSDAAEDKNSGSVETAVASVQEEMKALREQEEKRRSNWAKKMIEDVKQYKPLSQGAGTAAKIEAQKLLQAREERLRQKKEEEERKKKEEEAAEKQKKDEEEEKQRKAEEEKKKREEKDMKESIAQIVLPFQEVITTEADSTSKKSEIVSETEASSSKSTSTKSKEVKREPETKVQMIWESVYLEKINSGSVADLPTNFKIRLRFYENRGCPVTGCPNKRYFKKEEEFVSHWQIFHHENLTVRFCPKCSAYFANTAELEDHLRSRHNFSRSHMESMVRNARQKVIRNPSFRDPGQYMLPN